MVTFKSGIYNRKMLSIKEFIDYHSEYHEKRKFNLTIMAK